MPPKKIPKRTRCVVTHCDQPVFHELQCCKKQICAECFINIMEYHGEVDALLLRCPNCRRIHELQDQEIIKAFAANNSIEKKLDGNNGGHLVSIEPCQNGCTRCPNASVWVDPVTEHLEHDYVYALREDGTLFNPIPDRLCLRWLRTLFPGGIGTARNNQWVEIPQHLLRPGMKFAYFNARDFGESYYFWMQANRR